MSGNAYSSSRRRIVLPLLIAGVCALAQAAPAQATHVVAGPPTGQTGTLPPMNPNPGPSISGQAIDGKTLTGDRGSWSEPGLEFLQQWIRCKEGACQYLHADNQATYTVTSADIGWQIKLRVTAARTGPGTGSNQVDSGFTPAVAAQPPFPLQRPSFTGDTIVGSTLLGQSVGWGGSPPIQEDQYQWLRCEPPDFGTCNPIPGATGLNYTLTLDDANKQVRLRERATGPQHTVDAVSDNSRTVIDPANPPEPLSPFPLVAIGGRPKPRGVRITLLRVRGPVGATISISCRGRSCPFSDGTRVIEEGSSVRLRRLERSFRAGTVIVLRVTQPGRIGKYTRFRVRARRPPRRSDSCLLPEQLQPSPCP